MNEAKKQAILMTTSQDVVAFTQTMQSKHDLMEKSKTMIITAKAALHLKLFLCIF